MNAHIRNGVGNVRPYLHGPVEMIGFLKEVFGATELERHEFGPDSFHVELQIGDSVIALEAGELPEDISPWTNSIYVYVEDVDTVFAKAMHPKVTSIQPPTNKPYGERQAGFKDMAGNTWWVGTYTG